MKFKNILNCWVLCLVCKRQTTYYCYKLELSMLTKWVKGECRLNSNKIRIVILFYLYS